MSDTDFHVSLRQLTHCIRRASRLGRLTCLTLWISTSAFAQLALDSQWTAYTSMRQINDVIVDGDHVWMATNGGALHYDRANRVYRRLTRLDGLSGNRLLSVAMDDAGDLWFGTAHQGLCRLRRNATRFDPPFLEFRDRIILDLLPYGNRLYVATDRGISVFRIDTQEVEETYRRLGRLTKDSSTNAILIHKDTLFAGTRDGVAWADLRKPNLRDSGNWRSMPSPGAVRDMVVADDLVLATSTSGVFAFSPSKDLFVLDFGDDAVRSLGSFEGHALAVTQGGRVMQRLENGGWRRIIARLIGGANAISELDDSVWFATDSGLRVIREQEPPAPGEPASNRFYDIIRANDELWSASVPDDLQPAFSAGISRLAGGRWTVFDHTTGMPRNELVALETDREGRLWVGSWGDGISVRDDDEWLIVDASNSALGGIAGGNFVAVSDMARDSEGNMWIVNVAVGVTVIDGFPQTQGFLFNQVDLGQADRLDLFRIEFATQGHKWLASRTDGLVILDDGGTTFAGGDDRFVVINRSVEPRLTSNRAFDLIETGDGTLWLATDNGLNAIRARYDRATNHLDVDDWRVYSIADGLPSDEINVLETDSHDHLWVGTNAGLSRIVEGVVVFTLTTTNSNLINNSVTGLYYDGETNDLWIGTLNGLNRLHLGNVIPEVDGPTAGHRVFPNPFVNDGQNRLTFAGLALGAKLRIYSIGGELIASLAADPAQDTIHWDGLTDDGSLVASGLFFYVVENDSNRPLRGRFAVINDLAR